MSTTHRTHIQPAASWLRMDWRELVEYRDLLWFLVLREFTAIYKQSILGPLWFILQPLATTIVFTVVFGNIAKLDTTSGLPHFLFYFTSMVLWNYFQGCMNGVASSLVANRNLLTKVYFPRLNIPLSLVISNLGQYFLNFMVFLGFFFYFLLLTDAAIHPSWNILFLPLLIVQCAAVGLGVGLWLSALTTKYQDLRFALPFLAQLWMFATPVIYSADKVVTPKWRLLLALNPMSGIVEFNRFAFLGAGWTEPGFMLTSILSGWCVLVTGLLLFNRVQKTFADTI